MQVPLHMNPLGISPTMFGAIPIGSIYQLNESADKVTNADGVWLRCAGPDVSEFEYPGVKDMYGAAEPRVSVEPVFSMTSNTTPAPYVASASSEDVGQTRYAWRAFDTSAWVWSSTAVTGPTVNEWLQIKIPSDMYLISYVIMGSAIANTFPIDLEVQGSKDGVNWTTLDSQSGISWANNQSRTFTVANPFSYQAFQYFRLRVTRIGAVGSGYVTIQRFFLNVATGMFSFVNYGKYYIKVAENV